MTAILRAAALAGLSALLLTGCQTPKERANCPAINILANTSAFTAFKAGMPSDPANELFTIQMTSARSSCGFDADEGTTDSDIDITFRATRAPSGEAANFTAPYFVSTIQDGTTVVNKKILGTAFSFAPGESTITFSENVPSFVNRMQNGIKPYQYSLLVGLQLTKEQLDYLKTRRFTP